MHVVHVLINGLPQWLKLLGRAGGWWWVWGLGVWASAGVGLGPRRAGQGGDQGDLGESARPRQPPVRAMALTRDLGESAGPGTIRGSGKWDLGDVERGLSGLSRRIEQALQEEPLRGRLARSWQVHCLGGLHGLVANSPTGSRTRAGGGGAHQRGRPGGEPWRWIPHPFINHNRRLLGMGDVCMFLLGGVCEFLLFASV